MGQHLIRSAVAALAAFMATPSAATEPTLWTGVYAGVNAGYGFGGSDSQLSNSNFFGVPGDAYAIDLDGAIGGFQAGYDHQIGNLVLGLEASVSFGFDGSTTLNAADATTDAKGFGALTARVGFARERWLGYVRAGGAWASVEHQLSAPTRSWSDDEMLPGWVAGAGIEHMLIQGTNGHGISIGIEYLHYEFGSQTFSGPDDLTINGKPAGVLTDVEGDLSVDAITAKANLRF